MESTEKTGIQETNALTAAVLSKNWPVKAMAPFCANAEQYREANMRSGLPTQTSNRRATVFYGIIGKQGGE